MLSTHASGSQLPSLYRYCVLRSGVALLLIPDSREETRLRQEQARLEQQRREIEQARQQALALLAQAGG